MQPALQDPVDELQGTGSGTGVGPDAGEAITGTAGSEVPPPESDNPLRFLFEGFEIGDTIVTPVSLVLAVLIVLTAYQVSRFLQELAERGLRRTGIETESTIGTVRRIIHYGIIVLGFLIAVQQIGIRIETLLAAGAIFAVAFGFAMQNIAQNFVSGIIILIERSIKPGDVLEVEGKIVRVVEMGIRATIVRTLDDEEMIVPNSTLVQTTVKNFTLRDSLYRLRARVGVSYASDMGKVRTTLEETAREIEWRVKDHAPRVHLLEFGDSSVVWEVSVWIQNPWFSPRLLSRLYESVWDALKQNGITIAFPQMDLHLHPRLEEALGGPPASGQSPPAGG